MNVLLGEEAEAFYTALESPSPVSVRFNGRKVIQQWASEESVPWFSGGKYLPERPIFTLDPFLHAGAYYVQEASSMFTGYAFEMLAPKEGSLKVLDLCAAPGGKATLLADLLNDESMLVANEVIQNRYPILRENLLKWGYPNIVTTRLDASRFKPLEGYFDLVLVDAPCSGEGMFRKDPASVDEWSTRHISFCAARQKRILEDALPLVKPEGLLFYSTCTYNVEENEKQSEFIHGQGFECQALSMPDNWKIKRVGSDRAWGYQFFPHLTKGEGFFFSAFRKITGEKYRQKGLKKGKRDSKIGKSEEDLLKSWVSRAEIQEFRSFSGGMIQLLPGAMAASAIELCQQLGGGFAGIPIGTFKGTQFIPHQGLATSILLSSEIPSYELPHEEAILFLQKETIAPQKGMTGWHLIKYGGLGLGWIKALPNRINNYYPSEWRIRMRT